MTLAAKIPKIITESSGTWYVLAIQFFVRIFAETTLSKSASFANMISKVTQNGPAFFERIRRASFPSFLDDVIESPLPQNGMQITVIPESKHDSK